MTSIKTLTLMALAACVLAACGADGEPVQPTFGAGVSVGSSGIHTYGGLGVRKGPLSVFYGL